MKKLVKKIVVVLMVLCLASSVMAIPTTGLVLQLDMSDVTTTNVGGVDYVTSWNDQTAYDHHAVQADSAKQPILVSNITPEGKSAIKFDGTTDYFDITGNTDFVGGTWTMFVVYAADTITPTNLGTGKMINLGYDDIDPGTLVKKHTQAYVMIAGGYAGVRGTSRSATGGFITADSGTPEGYAEDTFYVAAATIDSASTNVTSYLYDGATTMSATATGSNSVGIGNIVARIGAGTSSNTGILPGAYFNGWISEVLIYNTVLNSTEITSVNEYLNAKYIPEPATISLLVMGVMGLLVRRNK
jgi:hypothetical protein